MRPHAAVRPHKSPHWGYRRSRSSVAAGSGAMMSGTGRLPQKVAVVTGGANGIGRAISALFAREGSKVVVVDRDVTAGEQLIKEIRVGSGTAVLVAADVSVESDIERAVGIATELGGLDIVVNCAGIALGGTVVDTEPARWQRVLNVNLAGAYFLCRLAIPRMMEAGGGSIVN